MPLRIVKKDRSEQAKQQTQAMAKPAPGILGGASKKAEEPKSPSERSDERKAKIREARMSTKTKRYGERYTPGMLTGGQAKLDKNKNNKIDAEDFKILKAEKKGKVMKAKRGDFMERRKKLMKKDPTKPVNPFEKKSSKFIERRKKLAGVKSLVGKGGRIGAAIAALGIAGAGAAKLGQTIGRKYFGDPTKKNNRDKAKVKGSNYSSKAPVRVDYTESGAKRPTKKMGGGMMKRPMGYTKGGGADTGKMGELRSKLGVASNKVRRTNEMLKSVGRPGKLKAPDRKPMKPLKDHDRLTERDIDMAKKMVSKKMGGGMMMNKPMGYKSGTSVKAKCKLGRNKPTKMY